MNLVDKFSKKNSLIIHIFSVLLFFSLLYTLFFSPVIFSGRLLAPGDGIVQSVPAFYSPRALWTDLILSGFPVAADPQVQTWYPISILFSFIPNSWNAFVISAYVLASCFSYSYVYTITKSKLAAIVSGIIYGMSGFMMAHLGHTMMIHTAVWMPLLILALEKLRHNFNPNWFLIGVFAVTCSIVAGHPQIAVYNLGLSVAYVLVLGWTASIGRWRYYRLYLAVTFIGIGLAAIQIIPTIELMNLGLRSKLTFEDFVAYSLPLVQATQIFFPYLFGGTSEFYKPFYFGDWNLTELVGYAGLLPLMLAVTGFLYSRSKLVTWFWFVISLFTLLLTFGKATPLAWLMYHLPVYNKFRVPARHFIEMTLAVSVLAGLGVNAIQKQLVSSRLLLKTVLVSAGVMLASLVGSLLFSVQLKAKVATGELNLFPWSSPAVGVPLVIFLLAASTAIYWSRLERSRLRQLLLLIILVIDLGSFGWFYEWQYAAPSEDILTPTASAQRYKDILSASQQRMLPIRGGLGSVDEIPANMSRLWGVPSASGYGPLILSRVSQLFPMGPPGDVSGAWYSVADQSLDIMSIRYVFMPKKASAVPDGKGVYWSTENMATSLGSGCGTQQPNAVKFRVPSHQSATAIGIVSSLACSTDVPNDVEVLRIQATDSSGKVATQNLRAGRDTSEWAYNCSDVLPLMQHSRALIYESFPVQRDSFPKCEGHKYVSILPLDELNNVRSVELKWVGTSGAISIQKISLVNDKTKQSYPIAETSNLLADTTRWHHVEEINQTSVYENLRAMPRAWLVPEVVSAKPEQVLRAIKSSQLPDGRSYTPSQIALVEERFNFKAQDFDPKATAKVVKLHDTRIEVQTNSQSPAFLVLSDVYYPGWQATIDGKARHVFQTNYVSRGILVPSGTHTIRFEFKPMSFHLGAGISAASLFLMGYIFIKSGTKQNI